MPMPTQPTESIWAESENSMVVLSFVNTVAVMQSCGEQSCWAWTVGIAASAIVRGGYVGWKWEIDNLV